MSINMILVGLGETPDTSQEAIDQYVSMFPAFSGKPWSGRSEQIVHVTDIPNVQITYQQILDPDNDSDNVLMVFLNSTRFSGEFMRRAGIESMDQYIEKISSVTSTVLSEFIMGRPKVDLDLSDSHPALPSPKHTGLVFDHWGPFFNERMSEIRRESFKSI